MADTAFMDSVVYICQFSLLITNGNTCRIFKTVIMGDKNDCLKPYLTSNEIAKSGLSAI